MAKLRCESNGGEAQTIELRLGINRLGRSAENDFQIADPSVSGTHCEIALGCGHVTVQDCGSSNGTYLDGAPIMQSRLEPGQVLRLGGVDLVVLDTEVPIRVPSFQEPVMPAPPVMLSNGAALCQCQGHQMASFRCTSCRALWCGDCIHRLRRRGGKVLCLCPRCSFPVEALRAPAKKKQSLFNRLCETTKMWFRAGGKTSGG